MGVQREFKGRLKKWLQHSDEPLSLSLFSFPDNSRSFLELSLMLQFTFSLPVFFYFFLNPPAAIWKIEEPHDHLPLFPPLSWMSMQLPEIAQMYSLFFSKSFSIFLQDSLPQSIVSICVKKKKPIGIVVCFQKAPVLELAMLLEVPK